MTEADLLQALRDCYDPLTRRNIVEMNLLRAATLQTDHDAPGAGIPGLPLRYIAHVTLTAPTSDDGSNAQLQAQVENRLAGMPAISRTEVRLLPPAFPILKPVMNPRRG